MDRDRLKDVHQTNLTEGRLNEDFVDWLKTKGPTWLLFVLVALVAYLAVVRYRQYQVTSRNEAWQRLLDVQDTTLPAGFEEVAREYGDVDGIGMLARLEGAERLLRSIQTGTPLTSEDSFAAPGSLSAQQRQDAIKRADKMYEEMIALDDGSIGQTVFAVTAYSGRAALAESRGDGEAARQWYEKAAQRAGEVYPQLAEQARHRIETLDENIDEITFPATVTRDPGPALQPAATDPAMLEIINAPPTPSGSAAATTTDASTE